MLAREDADTDSLLAGSGPGASAARASRPSRAWGMESGAQARKLAGLPAGELADLVQQLTEQMHVAAADLQFEVAARLRDEVSELKKELRQMVEANR